MNKDKISDFHKATAGMDQDQLLRIAQSLEEFGRAPEMPSSVDPMLDAGSTDHGFLRALFAASST